MKHEDVIELVVHPSFRAAVDRQVHATLVRLGLAQPAPPVLTDEDGVPLPESQQVPALVRSSADAMVRRERHQRGERPAPKPKVKRMSDLQRDALENGWVSSGAVQEMLGRTGAALVGYVKRGLLVRAAHGYYTKESFDRLKAWVDRYGAGSDGFRENQREANARWRKGRSLDVPMGYMTIHEAAMQYGKSYYTLRAIVVDRGVEHRREKSPTGGERLLVNAEALTAFMATYKGRERKTQAEPVAKAPAAQPTVPEGWCTMAVLAAELALSTLHVYRFLTNRNVHRRTIPGPRRGTVLVDRADFLAKWNEKPLAVRGPRKKQLAEAA